MDVAFATKKLAKICNSEKELRKEYGPRMASVIQTRLSDLAAVEVLAGMSLLPGRFHELTANLKGHFALDLVHPDRLVFKPLDDPPPRLENGAMALAEIRSVVIVGIGDYHGHRSRCVRRRGCRD